MEIRRFTLNHLPAPRKGLTLALGGFDGVHKGHASLLLSCAYEASGESGVLLFSNPFPGKEKEHLTSIEQRLSLLEHHRLDAAYIEEDEDVFALEPEEFIKRVLLPLGTTKVVIGPDYRFGAKAKGDEALLRKYFDVIVVPFVYEGSNKVATSLIKTKLKDGKIEEANGLLGHPYSLSGKTVLGHQLGRTIGFPTLNLEPAPHQFLPKPGVYFCLAYFKGRFFKSIVNVGNNPTLGDRPITIEAYLFQYDGSEDYGFTLSLNFLHYLREEKKFSSLEELKDEIEKDKAFALSFSD